MKKLTITQINRKLDTLSGWTFSNNEITKNFIFLDFKQTIETMVKVGKVAEEMNHHPEWFNVYNKLDIRLSTHAVNGVTELDLKLAKSINEITNQ